MTRSPNQREWVSSVRKLVPNAVEIPETRESSPIAPPRNFIFQKIYEADVELVDFVGNCAGIQNDINAWVAKKTENKITCFLSEDFLNKYTGAVILNAIYFKGSLNQRNMFVPINDAVDSNVLRRALLATVWNSFERNQDENSIFRYFASQVHRSE